MESSGRRPRGRPRKRRREDEGKNEKGGGGDIESGKKRAVEVEVEVEVEPPKVYVGRYVLKEFQGDGVFLGKIVYYDTGLYRVEYEDGDCEDLEGRELRGIVLDDANFDGDLKRKKKRLDQLVMKNKLKREELKSKETEADGKDVEMVELSGEGGVGNEGSRGDGDVDSDSAEVSFDGDLESEAETPLPPPPELPPSSGTIGVPDDCVLLLFSVYRFLRSFSIQLFLSPFGLDDFVGSLNCSVPNTLLDAVHISLMRVLRKHLESLSSDGLETASKCLRCADWSLLDNLTWPIFLIQYLAIMGYLRRPEWSGFSSNLLERDYYQLPIRRKLLILQILCDDVTDSSVVRAEIDRREELEVGTDSEAAEGNPSDDRPRRVHPRYSKTSACMDQEATEIIIRSNEIDLHAKCAGGNTNVVAEADENSDECRLCGMDGTLLCCDGCPSAYHSRCIGVLKMFLQEGQWYCPECTINKVGPSITKGTLLSGAVFFGTDPYGQVFLGTCDHLLVYSAPGYTESRVRYYNYRDILTVLHIIRSSVQSRGFYSEISTEMTAAGFGRDEKYLGDCHMYMGTYFKPQAYINNYMHGEFSASAAAKFAILSLEESKISGTRASGNSKKAKTSMLLQSKAFSLTASRFFWPSTEKKLVDVPRERCGWCHSCKAPPQSRRGCMLNNAASNAIRNAIKILPGLRPVMDGGGSLPSMATYILYMEECLRGLVVGPFMSARYREQWRSRVQRATALKALKVLLVELEENIRLIALSGDWVKLTDDWFAQTFVTRNTACHVGTAQARGPGRRRQRQQSSASEVTDSEDGNFSWWHGGKQFKQIFQKVSLPQLTTKRMARHAGWRRIHGISYADVSDFPKRSRQLVWRAAVDSSRNAAQLALQVRYLDSHVRWTDILRPENTIQDSKGQETETSLFRNATIFDKKIVEENIIYGVAFENQKHLPSRVMKNIIDIEKSQDGREKFWFSEIQTPLYLIKEFEEKIDEVPPPLTTNTRSNLSELQRRQLKASRKDIFTYLVRKRDKLDKCFCASCQLDVLLRQAVKCNDCEGYCHKDCTMQSVFSSNERARILAICKQCCHTKPNEHRHYLNSNLYSTTPLKEHHNLATVKRSKSKGCNQPVACVRSQESSSEKRAVSSGSKLGSKSRFKTWGIIWKKKNKEDIGMDFRRRNILPKGSPDIHVRPSCALCEKPYNSDLMYIRCETCEYWYHGQAVELEESRISDVVGFKCCKCRRIRSPICPYEDPESKRRRKKALNQESNPTESDSGLVSESKEYEAATPVFPTEEVFFQDDPLLSLSIGELVSEPKDFDWDAGFGPALQKLPVRRHLKREVSHADPTVYVENGGPSNSMESTHMLQAEWTAVEGLDGQAEWNAVDGLDDPLQAEWNSVDGLDGPQKLPVGRLGNHGDEKPPSPPAEWDASINAPGDEVVFDYDTFNCDMEDFEPQTYFSFTELLASEVGGQFDGAHDSHCPENLERMSGSIYSDRSNEQGGNEPQYVGESASDMVQCKMCSQTEPVPDLFCYSCGLRIHSSCSPWFQSSSWEDGWICGNCQEQQ